MASFASLMVTSIVACVVFISPATETAQCGNSNLQATSVPQYFSSPNYPNDYPNNCSCQFWITASPANAKVVLLLLDFNLESNCIYDNVTIYDGPNSSSTKLISPLCGQVPPQTFTSSGASITIVFETDYSSQHKGFLFQYFAQTVTDQCSSMYLANQTTQYITSPNYPNNYTANTDCQWHIRVASATDVVSLQILDFDLESDDTCAKDSVTIYDGMDTSSTKIQTLCGQRSATTFTSTGTWMLVLFHSDDTNSFKGFKLSFTSQSTSDQPTEFQLSATDQDQFITSPNYPNNYSGNTHNIYYITTSTPSDVVALTMLDFDSQPGFLCNFDKLHIYDGYPNSTISIVPICQNTLLGTVYISGGTTMTVEFISHSTTTSKGFKFQYKSQNKAALCGTANLYANGDPQHFTSPNYPYLYPNSMDCQWVITSTTPSEVVVLKMLDFKLTFDPFCNSDIVSVYDGGSLLYPRLDAACGHVSDATFTSTNMTLTIVFHSDEFSGDTGFKMEYASQKKQDECPNANLIANEEVKDITSPGYPNGYTGESYCLWRIKASLPSYGVVLTINAFNIGVPDQECNTAYVHIYNGNSTSNLGVNTLCGLVNNGTFTSTSTVMTVLFSSNLPPSILSGGFKMQYMSKRMSVLCAQVELIASSTANFLISPGYPNGYPQQLNCQWRITTSASNVIQLRSLDFHTEGVSNSCSENSVTVYDGTGTDSPRYRRFCGMLSNVIFLTTDSTMIVTFKSSVEWEYTGFKFEYTSHDRTALCGNSELMATDIMTQISSLNSSHSLPGHSHCEWHITTSSLTRVVMLQVENLNFYDAEPSCNNEYLAIYNGDSTISPRLDQLCGSVKLAQFTSTSIYMTIVFHSDYSSANVELKLSYMETDKPAFKVPVEGLDLSLPKEDGFVVNDEA